MRLGANIVIASEAKQSHSDLRLGIASSPFRLLAMTAPKPATLCFSAHRFRIREGKFS
jgi:hypothetical protein